MNKKLFSIVLSSIMVVAMAVPTFAASLEKTVTGADNFTKTWELAATSGTMTMTYGFNTFLVNEDYLFGRSTKYSHTASLKQGTQIVKTDFAEAMTSSDIQVQHSNNSVTWMVSW
ncbi:MAG: hypothetical protein RR635_02375 [Oscillospiraceae bacterium]